MFIVWRSRARQFYNETNHSARLVEAVRIDGRPRQKFIAFLGIVHHV